MNRFITLLALSLLASAAVRAEEAVGLDTAAIPLPAPQKAPKYPATLIPVPTGKVFYSDAAGSELSVAMCGVEGHGKGADLDAGLLDFNVPDPARAAGGTAEDPKDVGRNLYDYHSSVVLGVSLGYRF